MKVTIDTNSLTDPLKHARENMAAGFKDIKDYTGKTLTRIKEQVAPVASAVKEYGLGIIVKDDVHFCVKCGLNIEEFGSINYCPRCGKRL